MSSLNLEAHLFDDAQTNNTGVAAQGSLLRHRRKAVLVDLIAVAEERLKGAGARARRRASRVRSGSSDSSAASRAVRSRSLSSGSSAIRRRSRSTRVTCSDSPKSASASAP